MVDPVKGLFFNSLGNEEVVKEKLAPLERVSVNSKESKTFSLGNSANIEVIKSNETAPSPMHMIKDQNEQGDTVLLPSSEELDADILSNQISQLKGTFSDLALKMENISQSFDENETEQALQVMQLLNQDLSEIANNTKQEKKDIEKKEEGFTQKALNWCYSGEEILHNALLFLSDQNGSFSSLGDYLRLQYAVQRATQRTELFASIMGITISSIKTIMTTQLG